jgi:hypothetical protein
MTEVSVRIDTIEFDEGNIDHATSHGVTLAEIEAVFRRHPTGRRNRAAPTT